MPHLLELVDYTSRAVSTSRACAAGPVSSMPLLVIAPRWGQLKWRQPGG